MERKGDISTATTVGSFPNTTCNFCKKKQVTISVHVEVGKRRERPRGFYREDSTANDQFPDNEIIPSRLQNSWG